MDVFLGVTVMNFFQNNPDRLFQKTIGNSFFGIVIFKARKQLF